MNIHMSLHNLLVLGRYHVGSLQNSSKPSQMANELRSCESLFQIFNCLQEQRCVSTLHPRQKRIHADNTLLHIFLCIKCPQSYDTIVKREDFLLVAACFPEGWFSYPRFKQVHDD